MTTLSIVKGESKTHSITVFQSDGVTPQDITGAVLEFFILRQLGDDELEALVAKRSYVATEINITDALNGLADLFIRPSDVLALQAGEYFWFLRVTRQGTTVTSTGTLDFTAGSRIIASSGVPFGSLEVGQLLVPSGLPGNDVPVRLTSVRSANAELGTAYDGFVNESGVSYSIVQAVADIGGNAAQGTYAISDAGDV